MISVASSVKWRPFDGRLGDLLDRLTFHQQVIRDELNLAQVYAIRGMAEAQEQERPLAEKKSSGK